MVVFAVDIKRRMMELRGRAFNVDDAVRRIGGATASTEWLCPRPGRDASSAQILNAIPWMSRCLSGLRIEKFTSLEHRMHDHRQFACHRHCRSFESDPLPQSDAPSAQAIIG